MKEHSLNKQNPFIRGYYIDPDICDAIVDYAKQEPNLFSPGIKEYENAWLEHFELEQRANYLRSLFGCLEEYKKEFYYSYQQMEMWALRSGIKVQRYDPGRFYHNWHCENDGDPAVVTRHLVYMTYLNDIEEGGGTEFFHQSLQIKPEKGLTLIWPADWTHTHRGICAPNEYKYIITGWFVFNHTKAYHEGAYILKSADIDRVNRNIP